MMTTATWTTTLPTWTALEVLAETPQDRNKVSWRQTVPGLLETSFCTLAKLTSQPLMVAPVVNLKRWVTYLRLQSSVFPRLKPLGSQRTVANELNVSLEQ
jgi:hypothetical protein